MYDIADLMFMDALSPGDDGASETAEMPVSSALVSVSGIDNSPEQDLLIRIHVKSISL